MSRNEGRVLSATRFHRWVLATAATAAAAVLLAPAILLGAGLTNDVRQGLQDFDVREGQSVPPSAQALSIVAGLSGKASWNSFGTPRSLVRHGGYLATGLTGADAASVARAWINGKRDLFRLSAAGVTNLELVSDASLPGSNGHAVIFRQRFGSLLPAQSGLITVGVVGTPAAGWKIGHVSSSAAGEGPDPGTGSLTAQQAWVIAAQNVGKPAALASISNVATENSWTRFEAAGFSYHQRARLRAFPMPAGGVRPAWETLVLDFVAGDLTGYTVLVDAQTGEVLFRQNNVQQLAEQQMAAPVTYSYTGSYGPALNNCGKNGPFTSPPATSTITVAAKSTNDLNDIVLDLYRGDPDAGGVNVGHSDTATSPEAIFYNAASDTHPTNYYVRVCPFTVNTQDTYEGVITFNDLAGPPAGAFPYPPKWKFFKANPRLALTAGHPIYNLADDDIRIIGCWSASGPFLTKPVGDCQLVLENTASPPWDHNVTANTFTGTTFGNNAFSAEAWFAAVVPPPVGPVALGPGPTGHQPTSATRDYIYPWGDAWNNNRCSPLSYAPPASNDIDASVTNLFAEHNRVHDWSYHLGFTERAFNFQVNNFGRTPPDRENDPEVGSAQAGAVSGQPSPDPNTGWAGRNNANQLTLPDGVPGLTNMYLWQPRPASFYAPCVDGDFDMSVIAHEYGHGIQNRMVAGPDNQLTGHQARAMGESWSDLTAIEYLNEYNFVPVEGENVFAIGPYATGNKEHGIRNYNMSRNVAVAGYHSGPPFATPVTANPLNYSDVEYDNTGALSPHADGEIWSAANWDIRDLLIAKYNATWSASDPVLQKKCADGLDTADHCPGNRRWIQIVHDAFLLMADGAVSMLDARDAYLSADMMRFGGANQVELWKAFARRGMGEFATDTGANDLQPQPNFESKAQNNETWIKFRALAVDEGNAYIKAKIFVGHYEARATSIAETQTTNPGWSDPDRFYPGTYDFVAVAPGYGHLRFTVNVPASNGLLVTLSMPTNYASNSKGADIVPLLSEGVNQEDLIDDAEATDWAVLGRVPNVNGARITVALPGGVRRKISRVQVSALLRPEDLNDDDDPGLQNRFSSLRQFEIWTCNEEVLPTAGDCTTPALEAANYKLIISNASFPGERPRPVAPDMLLRNFNIDANKANAPEATATHVMLKVVSNQCTGGPGFQGDQDDDPNPSANSDCQLGSVQDQNVRAAELQVFTTSGASQSVDPVVVFTMTAPATAARGTNITYDMTYTNLGPFVSSNARITNVLPAELDFVSASNGGVFNAATRTVTWNLGAVPVNVPGTVRLTALVKATALPAAIITNQADYTADLTTATPAVAVTTVLP